MQKYRSLLLLFFLTAIFCSGILFYLKNISSEKSEVCTISEDCNDPTIAFGFNTDDYFVEKQTILPNEFLADILIRYGVSYQTIANLADNAKDIFDVRNLRAGKDYAIIKKDECAEAEYFVYQPNAYKYVMYNLGESSSVKILEKDVDRQIENGGGVVLSSLWNAMNDLDMPHSVIVGLEDALAWSIDFHHIQKGDEFKVIYEREYIDGEAVGVGQLLAAYFKNSNNEYYSLYFENPVHKGYFDENGRTMKKAFLKAPVQYSRISSPYNLRRFHPVLKRVKAHKGTDYAAPYGTPIVAVADGHVTKAAYTRGNGKYVKIKHDDVYSTQYLHMQRHGKGISPGVHVKQGQTIGYVGSTGLATGPHVCFRFWKNGKQVDHRREKLPPPEPMPEEYLPEYFEARDQYLLDLEKVIINRDHEVESVDEVSTPTSEATSQSPS